MGQIRMALERKRKSPFGSYSCGGAYDLLFFLLSDGDFYIWCDT